MAETSGVYLGLDIGTTGVKAAVFSAAGELLGAGLAEYTLETPRPDIVELEADVYWQSACAAVDAALKASGADAARVRSVGVTGQAETLIFTDENGVPVRKAVVWLDNRAREAAKAVEARFGAEALFRLSGQTEMLPCWPAAKILWLRNHEPEVFRRVGKFLMVEDYIFFKLTGRFATCRGLMPSSLYYDIRTGEYDRAMLDHLGIGTERLPELLDSGEAVGFCTGAESPLPGSCVAVAAPLDHICGNLGCGCVRPGMISETTGCTIALCANFPSAVYDEERRISTYHGFLPGSFALLPWAPTAGMLLKHLRDEFSPGTSYRDFDELAAKIPPGSEGLLILPHCAGAVSPVCNPDARGVAYGVTLAHKRGHWARAIMESVAFLLRDNIDVLRALGAGVSEVRPLGGAANSGLWLKIKADVLDLPLVLTGCTEATSLGAAILGAVGRGDFSHPAEAAERMVKIVRTVEPGADRGVYAECFKRYQHLDRLLMPTFGGNL